MIDLEFVQAQLRAHGIDEWADQLPLQLDALAERQHSDVPKWQHALAELPDIIDPSIDLAADALTIGTASDLQQTQQLQLIETLQQMRPWRKGPYSLFGVSIDTEWRSDWKWQRLVAGIAPLAGRTVLDVGCGNGYHCWRMAGEGASLVIGIDPSLLFLYQFKTMQKYIGLRAAVHLLPVGIEQMPANLQAFDTVFSMGVLYHRRSPVDHLQELAAALRPGGQLVLETLVIEGDSEQVLVPRDRYAKMRNVWFIPSVEALKIWLARVGFRDITLVDVTTTTAEEQRSTEWMTFESLSDFLDPDDPDLTIEGHPAPTRAVLSATR